LPGDPELKRVLRYVLGGSRGGENRARIINELGKRPMNLNQLAEKLSVDYRTIVHHVGVLMANSLVVSPREKYGAMYFLSPRLEAALGAFKEICASLRIELED
jgi:DNA-binding transcriptional ArsR family regulator